jgi:polyisoprenoid-binding protein YceI
MSTVAYQIDPAHSAAQFKVRHMMIANVKGEFTKVSGAVTYDPDNPSAVQVQATIDASSISTRDEQRDGHLKSADFFDVEKFPTITFQSKKVVPTGPDSFEAVGDLTIRGVAQPVALTVEEVTPEAKDPWGNMRRGATAKTKISRKDFGLHWNVALETGGFLVGDDIEITIDVELIRQAA